MNCLIVKVDHIAFKDPHIFLLAFFSLYYTFVLFDGPGRFANYVDYT